MTETTNQSSASLATIYDIRCTVTHPLTRQCYLRACPPSRPHPSPGLRRSNHLISLTLLHLHLRINVHRHQSILWIFRRGEREAIHLLSALYSCQYCQVQVAITGSYWRPRSAPSTIHCHHPSTSNQRANAFVVVCVITAMPARLPSKRRALSAIRVFLAYLRTTFKVCKKSYA